LQAGQDLLGGGCLQELDSTPESPSEIKDQGCCRKAMSVAAASVHPLSNESGIPKSVSGCRNCDRAVSLSKCKNDSLQCGPVGSGGPIEAKIARTTVKISNQCRNRFSLDLCDPFNTGYQIAALSSVIDFWGTVFLSRRSEL
jgi:hypothetical protein